MKVETYIDKEKFQFITSFEKTEIVNTKGEKIAIDFGELTIDERILLSSFLTSLVQTEGRKIPKENLYNLIFNFNNTKRSDTIKKTSFHDSFINTITEFLQKKPHFISYIYDNYKSILDNKTVIYRTQLNRSEMDALYSLKFQRSYTSFCNVLYIIGVAKSNIKTTQLNKISLDRFYNNVSMSKKRVKEIMEKLGIDYTIANGTVYFGNGFNIELAEKYFSEKRKEYNNLVNEEDILNSLSPAKKQIKIEETPIITETKKVEETPVIEEEYLEYTAPTKIKTIDIGDGRFDSSIFKVVEEECQEDDSYLTRKLNNFFGDRNDLRTKFFRKLVNKIGDPVTKISSDNKLKEVRSFIENPEHPFPNDQEWQVKKDIAKENLKKIAKQMYKGLEEIYDKNKEYYEIAVLLLFQNYKKLIKAIQIAEAKF